MTPTDLFQNTALIYGFSPTIIIIMVATALASWLVSSTLKRRFHEYSQIPIRYTGAQIAETMLREIVSEAAGMDGVGKVAAVHRIGELAIGEVSVAIATSAPHRAQAFAATRYVIEEIKKRLPVWKREHYISGENAWLPGERVREHERTGARD